MESGKTEEDNKKVDVETTFPIPYALGEIKENITISTNNQTKPSREQIINEAFKFHSQGNIEEATKLYQYFIDQGFKDYRIFSNYGLILQHLGKLKEAELLTRKAIQLNPNFADSYNNLGNILKDLGNSQAGEISTRKAIELNPNFVEAHYNLGLILRDLGRLKEAESSYRKAIELNPDLALAHLNLGNILKNFGNIQEAELSQRKAIELNPDLALAHLNLGGILRDLDRLKEAELSLRKAIELDPDCTEAHYNLGIILKNLGKLQDAELSYRKAIKLNPNFAKAQNNLAFILLKEKKFKEGFNKYEWRFKVNEMKNLREFEFIQDKPQWTPTNNGRVLLWREQGVGDEIYFSSLIPDFLDKVDKLILNIDLRLVPLLRRTFGDKIEYIDDESLSNTNDYDFHIAMGSLPKFLRPCLNSFQRCKKFRLKVDTDKSQKLRSKLVDNRYEKLVGISWKSKSTKNPNKSMHLERFILGINSPGIKFICLQYGEVKEEIFDLKKRHNIDIFEIEEIDNFRDIDGLASLINACDEVVTTNNVTVPLSGAIGVKTNVLLDLTCGWEYGIDDKKSYWFPSVKLFRQESSGEWGKPLDQIKKEISLS